MQHGSSVLFKTFRERRVEPSQCSGRALREAIKVVNLFVSMAERASTAMKVVIKLNFCYYMSRLDADSGVIMSKVTATTPLKRQEHHAIFCHAIHPAGHSCW
jgi:hypothetical protein